MAAERMKFEQWEREAMALVGKSDRGWQKLAAQMLDLSEMTIVKARKREEAGPTMTRKLRDAQARARDWTQLRDEAGDWVVSVPEKRAGGDIVCEIIVTRLIEPRFNAFFQFKKDGSVVRRADFFDTCEASVMQKMMRAAGVRAEERCRTERMAGEQSGRREELVRLAAETSGLDKDDLRAMSSIDLIMIQNRIDDEAREEIDDEVSGGVRDVRAQLQTEREEQAFDAGYHLGQLRLSAKASALLSAFGGEQADKATLLAGAYYKRRVAHKNSKRRAKEAGK